MKLKVIENDNALLMRGDEIVEVIAMPRYDDPSREAARDRVIARAYETRTLPYEVRNGESWIEAMLSDFAVEELDDETVGVDTPIGRFLLRARRARKGDLIHTPFLGGAGAVCLRRVPTTILPWCVSMGDSTRRG
jgi:hypothetical protein